MDKIRELNALQIIYQKNPRFSSRASCDVPFTNATEQGCFKSSSFSERPELREVARWQLNGNMQLEAIPVFWLTEENRTDLEWAEVEPHRDRGQLRHELEGKDGDALNGKVHRVARRAALNAFLVRWSFPANYRVILIYTPTSNQNLDMNKRF